MDISNARYWTADELNKIIKQNIPELKELEFKACDALRDDQKTEISKDVSAFANSAGGVIIYGIKEVKDGNHLHLMLDEGFELNGHFNKEWLENVIYSNISPKIENIYINPISLDEKRVIYVVDIPQSHTAHMAGNNKYYKRRNFKSEPMEDYEVRDVMNRQIRPKLTLFLTTPRNLESEHDFIFKIVLKNIGEVMVKYFAVRICIPEEIIVGDYKGGQKIHLGGSVYREYQKQNNYNQFLFPGFRIFFDNRFLPKINTNLALENANKNIFWTIFNDKTRPQFGKVKLGQLLKDRIQL